MEFATIISMSIKKLIWLVVGLVVLAALVAGYLYFFKPTKPGALDTTQKASEAVPTITTNAADKVPEVNPLDLANPFKYKNPLR